jgi:exodeoxyribonuclease V beta subunit
VDHPLTRCESAPDFALPEFAKQGATSFRHARPSQMGSDRRADAHELASSARPLDAAGGTAPATLNGMLKGFIDLVFEHDGRYFVADYKSNWLGPDDAAYGAEAMRAAILAHRYELQYALYLLALHRLLKARLPDYDYDRHVGGACTSSCAAAAAGPRRALRAPAGLIKRSIACWQARPARRMNA